MNDEERLEAEWALAQIILNPVLFREFINEDDKNWQPLERHERAWTACSKSHMAMCCGRSVHKTTTMIEMLYWWVISGNFIKGDQPNLFVMVPNKAQKDLSFGRIASACRKHWLIRRFVDRNKINMTEGRIDFLNGFQFILRIAGAAGTEDNVIGVHTTKIWVDEAQEFPWKTWQSLQNCLKFEIEGHRMIVSGVPNGERKENVLYHCDQMDEAYISFNISQVMMSWWTPEIELKRRREFSAVQEDSEDYKHFVLGQHGVPTYSIFDRVRFKKEEYDENRITITPTMLETIKHIDDSGAIHYRWEELYAYPPLPASFGMRPVRGIGYDVGFSPDPSVYFIMYEDTTTGFWKSPMRFVLERIPYPAQREFFLFLDKIYDFDFLGIDMVGVGKVQWQDLAGENAPKELLERNYAERLFPVEFGSSMVVAAKNENGEIIEKKDQVKRVAVETLSRWAQESQRFIFSTNDDSLMSELERTKFMRTNLGEPLYKTIDDHQMAAMMCAIMAYENRFGVPIISAKKEINIKLAKARWLTSSYGAYYGRN